MCVTIGICGVVVGLLEMVIAIIAGGVSCLGLAAMSGVAACGIISFFLFAACLLGINGILGVFGFGILDLIAGSAMGGYLGYFGTFIEQGGNIYDACRICIAGK